MTLRDTIARYIDPASLAPKAYMGGNGIIRARRANAFAKASKIIDHLKDNGLLAQQIPHLGKCT